ncbi:MAG: hypothetical protein NVV70_10555 [Cellulomonas sp.]|nr:hypothetical protein [Cellulomonas sp.]MCR6648547.1 hypothetical protein [Cellulomonas sp.]
MTSVSTERTRRRVREVEQPIINITLQPDERRVFSVVEAAARPGHQPQQALRVHRRRRDPLDQHRPAPQDPGRCDRRVHRDARIRTSAVEVVNKEQ